MSVAYLLLNRFVFVFFLLQLVAKEVVVGLRTLNKLALRFQTFLDGQLLALQLLERERERERERDGKKDSERERERETSSFDISPGKRSKKF